MGLIGCIGLAAIDTCDFGWADGVDLPVVRLIWIDSTDWVDWIDLIDFIDLMRSDLDWFELADVI